MIALTVNITEQPQVAMTFIQTLLTVVSHFWFTSCCFHKIKYDWYTVIISRALFTINIFNIKLKILIFSLVHCQHFGLVLKLQNEWKLFNSYILHEFYMKVWLGNENELHEKSEASVLGFTVPL